MKYLLEERATLLEKPFADLSDKAKQMAKQDLANKNDAFSAATQDWKAKIDAAATADDKKQVWDEFFSAFFGEKADKAKEINAGTNAIVEECLEYGFDEQKNPFLAFLKNRQNDLMDLIDSNSYVGIHNAVAGKYITEQDLRNSRTDLYNILNCYDLYQNNADNVENYLELQKYAIDSCQGKNGAKFKNAILKDRFDGHPAEFIKAVFYASGNPFSEDKPQLGNINEELKSLDDISDILHDCFGDAFDQTMNDSASAKTKKADKIKSDDLVRQLKKLMRNSKNMSSDDKNAINKIFKDFGYGE